MQIKFIDTPNGPITEALYDGMSSRLVGQLSPQQVQRQLNIMRALASQCRYVTNLPQLKT